MMMHLGIMSLSTRNAITKPFILEYPIYLDDIIMAECI